MRDFRTHLSRMDIGHVLLFVIPLVFFISCGDDETPSTKSMTFDFKAEVNGQPLEFNTGRYMTASGNEISIDRLKIYISNVKLINTSEQSSFDETDSYHLVNLNVDNTTYSFQVDEIPSDFAFNKVEFAIGVDTDKNFSLDNIGDLDPANDMAWNWNTGYKFFLMEGNFYPPSSTDPRGLILHIGHDKNYKEFSIDLTSVVSINNSANISITLDALAPLNAPNQIDLTDNSDFQGSEASDVIAENYASGLINSVQTNIE